MQDWFNVKAQKCEFHSSSVQLLWFVVERGQFRANPAKIKAVVQWLTPTRKQLQRFWGFANVYRQFIRNFSCKVEPVTRLTSAAIPFLWTPEADVTFISTKHMLASSSVLTTPNPDYHFVVEVDASDAGVEGVSDDHSTRGCIPAPPSHIASTHLNIVTTLVIGNCWPLSSL